LPCAFGGAAVAAGAEAAVAGKVFPMVWPEASDAGECKGRASCGALGICGLPESRIQHQEHEEHEGTKRKKVFYGGSQTSTRFEFIPALISDQPIALSGSSVGS